MKSTQSTKDLVCLINRKVTMQVIEFLEQNDNVPVNQIYNTLHLEQSIVSQSLSLLRNFNLVEAKKEGKNIFYSLNKDKLGAILNLCDKMIAA